MPQARGAGHTPAIPLAVHDYCPGGLDAALTFLKRTRNELRQLRMVSWYKDSKKEFLKKYVSEGSSLSMAPLTGDAYNSEIA